VSARLCRKVADFQGWVFPEASGDRADPARRLALRLPVGACEEPLKRRAQAIFAGFCLASVSEGSRLYADATSDPKHDGQTWKQSMSQPRRIELDLDLFESYRRCCVAMPRAGAIKDRGWAADEPLPNLGLVQIGADYKERENGPVMGMLWHAGAAAVDDPSNSGSAEASQHRFPARVTDSEASYIKVAARAVKMTITGDPRDLESVQYELRGPR
jgi:hypothetical protein